MVRGPLNRVFKGGGGGGGSPQLLRMPRPPEIDTKNTSSLQPNFGMQNERFSPPIASQNHLKFELWAGLAFARQIFIPNPSEATNKCVLRQGKVFEKYCKIRCFRAVRLNHMQRNFPFNHFQNSIVFIPRKIKHRPKTDFQYLHKLDI